MSSGCDDNPRQPDDGAMDDDARPGQRTAPELIEHIRRPRNLGMLPNADVAVTALGSCGDAIDVSLVVKNRRIQRVGYMPHGCAFTLACASVASTMAQGRTLAEARREVQPMAIDAALGGLPEDHGHCASLAASAIWKAITVYLSTENEPWKRLYR